MSDDWLSAQTKVSYATRSESGASVYLRLDRLDIAQGIIFGQLDVVLPREIIDDSIAELGCDPNNVPSTVYIQAELGEFYHEITNLSEFGDSPKISIEQQLQPTYGHALGDSTRISGKIQLQVFGTAHFFPLDQYFFAPDMDLVILDRENQRNVEIPIAGLWAILVPPLSQIGFESNVSLSGESRFVVKINREIATLRYAGSMMVLFVLVSLCAVLLLFRCHLWHQHSPWEGVIGIVAISLSILPLRSVVVPSDIQVITLFDSVLAICVSFLLTAAVIRMAIELLPVGLQWNPNEKASTAVWAGHGAEG